MWSFVAIQARWVEQTFVETPLQLYLESQKYSLELRNLGLVYFTPKTKRFSRFSVTSNLLVHA